MIQTKARAENMKTENSEFDVYKDMQARTNGEIYIGVVGPVRTGKSTFIKRFMDVCVLPHMTEELLHQGRRRAGYRRPCVCQPVPPDSVRRYYSLRYAKQHWL